MRQGRRLPRPGLEARLEDSLHRKQDALCMAFGGGLENLDGLRESIDGLLHLVLRLLIVLVLLLAHLGGHLDVTGELLDPLGEVLALGGELDAAVVEVGDVGRELVRARLAGGVRLALLADDGRGPTHEGIVEIFLGLGLFLDVRGDAVEQLHHARDGAQARARASTDAGAGGGGDREEAEANGGGAGELHWDWLGLRLLSNVGGYEPSST
mmetsp:Transcript_42399/g.137049  ORF Transcript_42399/g.137049 Transcript_42399/m.137049 type:complete len:211 (+) Transcript_42399:1712-2344(+)